MNFNASFSSIPVVDLARWNSNAEDRQVFARELCDICHHVGFFQVINHDIDNVFMNDLFALLKQFFALPEAQKRLIDKRKSRHFRGWEDVGSEYTNNAPDIREQVDLWSELPCRDENINPVYMRLLGPNQWLPDSVLPEFKSLSLSWFEQAGNLANQLLEVLSLGLKLEHNELSGLFGEESMSLVKLIHYPPTPDNAAGVNPHHDTGFLTVLAPSSVVGLQVQNASGEWISVPSVPGAFVINLGEMLQAMTGQYFIATAHRVITRQERYSIGYFHGPTLDTKLSILNLPEKMHEVVRNSPRHLQAGFMALKEETESGVGEMQSSYKPSVYGEQLWNYFVRSYPDVVKHHYPNDVSF